MRVRVCHKDFSAHNALMTAIDRGDGLTPQERRTLAELHEAAAYLTSLLASLSPVADVFNALNDVFPLTTRVPAAQAALGWGPEVHQPMLAPIYHAEPIARCAAAEALGITLVEAGVGLTVASVILTMVRKIRGEAT